MEKILSLFFYLTILAIASRFFYIQGLKDSDFDRARENIKLQNCLSVLRQ